jgi:hypothetical protein
MKPTRKTHFCDSFLNSGRNTFLLGLFCIGLTFCLLSSSCRKKNYDPTNITVRPRVFIEGAAPIPILDEYDFTGVQLGTFSDVFSNDGEGRIFALWLSTDRRAAITLQKETARHLGRRLSLVVNGQAIAVHPIEKTITEGYIPFLFVNKIPEEQVMVIYNKFSESLVHLKAEFEDLKN